LFKDDGCADGGGEMLGSGLDRSGEREVLDWGLLLLFRDLLLSVWVVALGRLSRLLLLPLLLLDGRERLREDADSACERLHTLLGTDFVPCEVMFPASF